MAKDLGRAKVVIGGIGDADLENLLFFLREQLGGEFVDRVIALLTGERLILGQITALGIDFATTIN